MAKYEKRATDLQGYPAEMKIARYTNTGFVTNPTEKQHRLSVL